MDGDRRTLICKRRTHQRSNTLAEFGYAVALSSTHALISTIGYDYTNTDSPPVTSSNSGNAYLYTISGGAWTGTNGLLSVTGAPTAQAGAQFGYSVALSSTHALISAYSYNYTPSGSATAINNSGNAYLYDY